MWERVRRWTAAIAAAFLAWTFVAASSDPAEARRYRGYGHSHFRHAGFHYGSHHRIKRYVYFRRYARRHVASAQVSRDNGAMVGQGAGLAAIVVDANSGRVLYGRNEREQRHPASVTKVMTLYLLFEQLERGRLRLDSPLMISSHAASRAPSKLGLSPGETIEVEDAIKALVTKSANDIAAAIAENIGGDEDSFARTMTAKARQLGMRDTYFANASGLPDSRQLTTAQDLAVLGRAIQDRFPRYYRYFSTHVFAYGGAMHRNHNHLLGRVEGMDGIKTGYTRASGFNLLTSVRRGGRHIVAVVLGGRTAGARDHAMASLIEERIADATSTRTAHAITEEQPSERAELEPIPVAQRDEEPREEEQPAPPPRSARAAFAARLALAAPSSAPLAPPATIPTPARVEKARPAFVSGVQKRAPEPVDRKVRLAQRGRALVAAVDGSTAHAGSRSTRTESPSATTPSTLRRAGGAPGQMAKVESAGRPAGAGWMIQIGATEDADKAHELLSRARSQLRGFPSTAKAFTEKVQKGKETLWRARFAGLEEHSAESACKALKRSGFSCFATKN
jgi:D-alanyl-D-alanine carboxypeptidase